MGGADRPTRRYQALVGYLLKAEFDAVLSQTSFELANPDASPGEAWRLAGEGRRGLGPVPSGTIEPLPKGLRGAAALVRKRPAYHRYYERVGDFEFGLAPIESLLSPQFYADTDYVDELAKSLGPKLSLGQVFDFAMPSGRLTSPIVQGNSVLFSSTRMDLFASPVPEVVPSPNGFTIKIEAESRPNLVQVASLDDRLVLINGVHKALALRARGETAVPCVWRRTNSIEELGLPQGNLDMFRPAVMQGTRPARLVDFRDEIVAVPLLQPATTQVLRVVLSQERFSVPLPIAAAAM